VKPRMLPWVIAILGVSLLPSPALADNCSDLSDCFSGNINPAIWVILGLLAVLLIALLIGSLGGGGVLLAGLRALLSRAGVSAIARGIGRFLSRFVGRQFAPGRLMPHFQKHAPEFGYRTVAQYLRGAQQLVRGGKGIQTFTRANGDKLFYNPATNEFAVLSRDGIIRTYFKPTDGINYWLRQIGGP
jgi:hypothetical protein